MLSMGKLTISTGPFSIANCNSHDQAGYGFFRVLKTKIMKHVENKPPHLGYFQPDWLPSGYVKIAIENGHL